MDEKAPNFNVGEFTGNMTLGNIYGSANVHVSKTSEEPTFLIDYSEKDLVDAASEIKRLLVELQNQGMSSSEAQKVLARELEKQGQSSSSIKQKLTAWAQFLTNASTTGVIGGGALDVLKLALKSLGIPTA